MTGASQSTLPGLKDGITIESQPLPGKPDRRVLIDRTTGAFFELAGPEEAICRRLDGATSAAALVASLAEETGITITEASLRSFVRNLGDQGLLNQPRPAGAGAAWDTMHRLPVDADRLFQRLARWKGWLFTRPAVFVLIVPLLVTLILFAGAFPMLWYTLTHVFDALQEKAAGGIGGQDIFRFALILVVIPFFRELAKGLRCRAYACPVPELRYGFFLRFIFRIAPDISSIQRLAKRERLIVLASGIYAETWLLVLAVLVGQLVAPGSAVAATIDSVVFAAAVGMFFNIMPTGRQDGAALLAAWREIPDYRTRAVAWFRSVLFMETRPEALAREERPAFFVYGFLADLYNVVIHIVIFGLIGYLLTGWMDRTGAMLFVILLVLKFEDTLRGWLRAMLPGRREEQGNAMTPKKKKTWIKAAVAVVILVIIYFIPYPMDVSGEFRVEPGTVREIRSDVQAQIERVFVEQGQWVEEGEPIVKLSERIIRTELDAARAEMKSGQARLAEMEAGTRPEQLAMAEQQVTLTSTALRHSQSHYDRIKSLFDKGHVAQEDYDLALRQLDIDKDANEMARRELSLYEAGTRPEEIEIQKAELERLKVQVEHLEDNLRRTEIRSPVSGHVSSFYLDRKIGQMAQVGDVVATVQNAARPRIRIALPQDYASYVETGADVRARPWGMSGTVLDGTVMAVLPAAIEKSQDQIQKAMHSEEGGMVRNAATPDELIIPVIAELEVDSEFLRSDMTGYAKIRVGIKPFGYALLHPVIRFFQVQVWSWIP